MTPSRFTRLVAGIALAVYAVAFVALAVFIDPWAAFGTVALGAVGSFL